MSSDLCEKLLKHLEKSKTVDTFEYAQFIKENHQTVVGAVKSLQSLGDLIVAEPQTSKRWELTEEGHQVATNGSYEYHVFHNVPPDGISQDELSKRVSNFKVGFSKAMSSGWVSVDKSSGTPVIYRKKESVEDAVALDLQRIRDGQEELVAENFKQDYKKRKLLQQVVTKSFLLNQGPNFTTCVSKPETDLTPEMIATGSWKEKTFKPYNLDAMGVPPDCGHLHPLLKVRAQFRQIFLEMGFTEMPTNNFIESSFWNFDALFQPQQHPARDAHDTFFISEPCLSTNFPEDYLQKVKKVHTEGGYGSQGYGYDWKLKEAQKNLLRTHTTAVSARMLYKLAQCENFHAVKYFSIDRVFRNETLDATHLAEFHQIEGVIADYDLTLGDLIGTLYEFFGKLGITQLYFKPAYNPYTEPSMEIFSYHTGLGKWMEIGNSGMFRPEMLRPMGIPEDVNVIAWGLSLERPTMIKYKLNNIRDLVGPKVDLQMVHDSPICRLEKSGSSLNDIARDLEKRWDLIQTRLEALRQEVAVIRGESSKPLRSEEKFDVVITANPQTPPYSLLIMFKLLLKKYNVDISTHVHSSVISDSVVNKLMNEVSLLKNYNLPKDTLASRVTLIWKNVKDSPRLLASPVSDGDVLGEANILRYFNRLLEVEANPVLTYENSGCIRSGMIDSWLDKLHLLSSGNCNKVERSNILNAINTVLVKSDWLVGRSLSLADIFLWSLLRQLPAVLSCAPHNVKKWYSNCQQHSLFK